MMDSTKICMSVERIGQILCAWMQMRGTLREEITGSVNCSLKKVKCAPP